MKSNRQKRPLVAVHVNPVSAAVATAVGSLSFVTLPANAQQEGFFEEIVVTASRRATDTQDIPYNIAAFSGQTLERRQIENLADLARWVPGLTLLDQGQRAANVLTVRGLSGSSIQASEFLDNSSGGTVGIYVGEIATYVDLNLLDMDRVEVLLGPQGTLFGAGTLTGALRYIPNKPRTDEFTLDLHANTNVVSESDDVGYGGDLTLNVPIISDKLAFRGTVGYNDQPGYIDYNYLVREAGVSNPEPDFDDPDDVAANLTSKKDVNDVELLSVRAALLWNVADDGELLLSYDYQNKDVGGRNITHRPSFGGNFDEYTSAMRFVEPNERENQLLAGTFIWNFDFAESTTAVSIQNFEEDGQRDQTDLLLNLGYTYPDFPSFAAFTSDVNEEDTTTFETRLVSTHGGPVNWIVGGFYSDWESDAISEEFTPGFPAFVGLPPLPDLEYFQKTDQTEEEKAVFGELGYQLTDRWQVTVGARWFDYETDATITVDLPLIDSFGEPESAKVTDDDFIFKFNSSLDLEGLFPVMESGTAYLTISEGYGLGGVNVFAPCPPNPTAGQNICLLPDEQSYGTQETLNYEIGIKSNWLDDGNLRADLALFLVEWDGIQIESTSINGDVPITVNAGEAQSWGTEFATRWQITDNWAVYGAYAYTHAKLTELAPASIGTRFPPNATGRDGDRLPGTPENQGSLNVLYSQNVFQDLLLEVDYGFTSQSDVYTKIGNRGNGESLGGFTLHNASVSVSSDEWIAQLYVKNLTDKFAVTGVRSDRDFIDRRSEGDGIYSPGEQFTLRRYFYNVVQPSTIGIDFRYFFDFN